jgi:hypothetical protein
MPMPGAASEKLEYGEAPTPPIPLKSPFKPRSGWFRPVIKSRLLCVRKKKRKEKVLTKLLYENGEKKT